MPGPLDGLCVLVTRPPGQEHELIAKLEALGPHVLYQPLVGIRPPDSWEPVDTALRNLERFDWIAFTSVNGVEQLLARTGPERLNAVRVAAIGPTTARRLRELGVRVDLIPQDSRAEGLADAMENDRARRILLVQPDRGRPILAERLARFAAVERIAVYRQVDVAQLEPDVVTALGDGEVDYVLLSSGNIARRFLTAIDDPARNHIQVGRTKLVTISPVTSAVVHDLGFPVTVEALTPGDDGLIDVLLGKVS